MQRKLIFSVMLGFLLTSLITIPAMAAMPTPLPTPTATNLPPQGSTADQISFAQLGQSEMISLQGPFSSTSFDFNLPANWHLQPNGAALHLSINRFFSSLVPAQGENNNVEGIIAGNLSLALNGVSLGTLPLQNNGSEVITIPLSQAALQPDPASGQYTLTLQWEAGASCNANLATSVLIQTDSYFSLPHSQLSELPIDLAAFPYPLYAPNASDTAPVTLVVPDQPTQVELQAALAVATGLGRLSRNQIDLSLVNASQLNDDLLKQNHIIYVAKQLPALAEAALKTAPRQGGIIWMSTSTVNPERVIMVISGAQDALLMAAASAVNGGLLIPGSDPRLAEVQPATAAQPIGVFKEDIILSGLAPAGLYFNHNGSTRQSLNVTLPVGTNIGADAYLDLNINHSQLIDYLRSGLVVRINGIPIGSIRLSDTTAGGSLVRLVIPASIIHPGTNTFEFQADIAPRDICVNPQQGSLWINIFKDSLIHLPVANQSAPLAGMVETLGNYPQPLAANLAAVRLVLPANDPNAWNAAALLAANLGSASAQPGFPELAFASDPAERIFDGKSLLIMGTPAQLPFLAQLNSMLPVPLNADASLSPQVQSKVTFRLDSKREVGFIELAPIPSTPGSVIYAILGNQAQGVQSAARALLSSAQKSRLSTGNFAVVQGSRLAAQQIAPAGPEAVAPLAAAVQEAPVPDINNAIAAQLHQEVWVLPVLLVSIALILGLIGLEIYSILRKNQ